MIYLDHAATTPIDERVFDAMLPFLRDAYGNAASPHAMGQAAAGAVEEARGELALSLGADPREIVFTSGATEANNLAIKGACRADAHGRLPRRVVTCSTEHHAVLDPCDALAKDGFEVVRLAVDGGGALDLAQLDEELARGVRLVSIMSANNETGVRHPIDEIGRRCREAGALFHTDATQSFGKEPIDVDASCIDLLSLSAHKLYGPKGVGALFLRRKRPRVRVEEMQSGGGHEGGRRSGTLNVAGIVGLGAATKSAQAGGADEQARIAALRDHFEVSLQAQIAGLYVNGHSGARLAGHSNVSFPGAEGDKLLRRVPDLCASTAAACTTASLALSHVLRAMGLDSDRLRGSVRFSIGRATSREDVDGAVAALSAAFRDGPRD